MNSKSKYNAAKLASYLTGFSMSVSANLPPLLFLTFKNLYGLSYTQLGSLVVINFFTQLFIDLVFAFFSKHFNIHKTIKLTPFIVFSGLVLYAVLPLLFPSAAFLWIIIGTVIFSVASGLSEVLLSPLIAAIPSDNPEGEMSKLHSMYAWGVVIVVILSTLFITFFGGSNWMFLALFWSLVPLSAFIVFTKAELPPMQTASENKQQDKNPFSGILLCLCCIFLGGAAECTMSQWASGFIEIATGVPKVLGDVSGVALFALLLGIARTAYSKFGKNIINFLFYGMVGAAICYIVAGSSLNSVISIIACAFTGLFTAMLWPGTLIYIEEKFSNVGVAIYALMAAGGDLGASLAPQLLGIISDRFALTDFAANASQLLNISAEQIGMRAGILVTALFPFTGIFIIICMKRYFKHKN